MTSLPAIPSAFPSSSSSSNKHATLFPQLPMLSADDEATLAQRMEAVQNALPTLSLPEQVDFLLSSLYSAHHAQLQTQCEKQRSQASSAKAQLRATETAAACRRMQQRVTRLLSDAADLQADVSGIEAAVLTPPGNDGGAAQNGKEEKQQNGHSRPHSQPHPSSSHSSAPRAGDADLHPMAVDEWAQRSSALSDFATLLATTEAQLAVERREREAQSTAAPSAFPPPSSSSSQYWSASAPSPYYHHDHTLTAAGKAVVHSIFLVFAHAGSGSLSLPQLQALCERAGRDQSGGDVDGGGDDGGDVWWVWQSHASEDEAGAMGMSEADLQAVYEQEWDLNQDATMLRVH